MISVLRMGGLPLGRKLFPLPVTETHLYCYRPVWLILVISAISRSGATVHPDQAESLDLQGFRQGSNQGKFSNGYKVRDAVCGWGTGLQGAKSRVGFPMGSLSFFIDLIQSLRQHSDPLVDSASDRYKHQWYLPCLKAASAYFWQPCHFQVPIFLKFSKPPPPGPLKGLPNPVWV
jgi:hypothetical protein